MGILTWLFGRPNLEPQKEKSEPVTKAEADRPPIERNPNRLAKPNPTRDNLQLRKYRGEYEALNDKQCAIVLHPNEDGWPPLRLRRRRGSLWLFEDATGARVPHRNRQLWKLGIWGFNIRGSAYYGEAVRDGDLRPGQPVNLIREPDNEYDPNAIRICADNSPKTVGYVNKGNARMLARRLDAGEPLVAIALNGDRPGVQTEHGIGVLITDPETMKYLSRKPERRTSSTNNAPHE